MTRSASLPGWAWSVVLVLCQAAALCACLAVALLVGAVRIPPPRLLALLLGALPDAREAAVLWQIRLPRAALAVAVGAALAVAGSALQGLFRNPLADPALVGVSSGAALGAVAAIVLAGPMPASLAGLVPARAVLPVAAFAGGLAATLVVLRLARAAGGGTAGLLLAGIAVNAVAGAGTGLLVTASDDRQLRDITFWSLGSLAAGGWVGAASAGACALVAAAVLLPAARSLDALLLGEIEAAGLGVNVARLRLRVVAAVALAVAGAVAAAGVIGFVGLVVPHLVRAVVGPLHRRLMLTAAVAGACLLLLADALARVAAAGVIGFVGLVVPHLVRAVVGPLHRRLMLTAAVAGACLLLLADALARVAAAPVELPVGLVTSLLGGPFFVLLLLRARGR